MSLFLHDINPICNTFRSTYHKQAEMRNKELSCNLMSPGLGIGMVVLSGVVCIYYNVIICWTIHYLFKSFTRSLPWSKCGNSWNTPLCLVTSGLKSETPSSLNSSHLLCTDGMMCENNTVDEEMYAKLSANTTILWKSPAEEYWQ